MKKLLLSLLFLVALSVPTVAWAQSAKISEVYFYKNVELFGYMVHLAEPNGADPEHPISRVLNSHPEDANISALHQIYGIAADMSYSFFVQLFVQIPEFPHEGQVELSDTFLRDFGLDSQEKQQRAHQLVALANTFYKESHFASIWEELETQRIEKAAQIENSLPPTEWITAMEGFYEQYFTAYRVIPSLTVWSGPGWGFPTEGEEVKIANFVLGPLDKSYDFSNQDLLAPLTVHEFGHSFTNHLVLKNKALIEQSAALFAPLEEAMRKQGYPAWEDCVVEHFVRAGEVLIPEIMGNKPLSTKQLKQNTEERSFVYLPFIVNRLRHYRVENKMAVEEAVRRTMLDLNAEYVK